MGLLENQVALVTGGSSGIGKSIAYYLAKEGANVAVNYYSDKEGAEDVVKSIEALGKKAFAVQADVGDEADVARMFDAVFNEYGNLDILISNAGIQKDAPFHEMTLKDWNY